MAFGIASLFLCLLHLEKIQTFINHSDLPQIYLPNCGSYKTADYAEMRYYNEENKNFIFTLLASAHFYSTSSEFNNFRWIILKELVDLFSNSSIPYILSDGSFLSLFRYILILGETREGFWGD